MLRSTTLLIGMLTVVPLSPPRVIVEPIPSGGIQPQAVVDSRGALHVLYFEGDPSHGDLFYVHREPGRSAFSAPVHVNSETGTAIATGSIRGGQLAVGRGSWIHVAWHGAQPIDRGGSKVTPIWYARMAPGQSAFEEQRPLGEHLKGMDGGSIAADRRGNVHVAWHAMGDVEGESHRRVYVASSHDNGSRFDPDQAIVDTGGACGCCGLRALVGRDDRLQIIYRAAGDDVHRDTTWISVSREGAATPVTLHPWELRACPMSTFAMANAGDSIVAAWETQQQIYVATLDPARTMASAATAIPGSGARRHPSVAVNAVGDRLIAWTDGTAWGRGGTFAWELQNRHGGHLASGSNAGTVPVWGLVAAVAMPDGSFLILH